MQKFHLLAWALFAWLLWSVMGCTNSTITKGDNMSNIIFYADLTSSFPASPGAANDLLTLNFYKKFFGVMDPTPTGQGNTPPVYGCADNSFMYIKRYRYVGIGAQGLRAGVNLSPLGVNVYFRGRENQASNYITFPFVQENEWNSVEKMMTFDGSTIFRAPDLGDATDTQIYFDTRNLQPLYYESLFALQLQIEVECVQA